MASNPLTRYFLRAIQLSSNLATLAACRLVRWTGKSSRAIHPKHLVGDLLGEWYVSRVRPDDCILDLGAGVGTHAGRCRRAGARQVVGVDRSEKNLAAARALVAPAGVRLVRCDATKPLPFRSEVFTGALLLDILEHLHDAEAAVRECVRVLRPGAWVAVALPNSETTWKQRYRRAGLFWMSDRDHKQEYRWPEIVQLLEAAGLRVGSGPDTIALDTPLTGWIDLIGGFSLGIYRRVTEWRIREAARRPRESTGFRCIAIKL
jgi:SAM-dependent methyltransferase